MFVACGLECHALNGRQKSLGLGEAMSPCHAGPAGGPGKGRRPTCLKMTWGSDEVGEACLSRFEPCPPGPHTLFPSHLSHGIWLSLSVHQNTELVKLSLTQWCLLRWLLLTPSGLKGEQLEWQKARWQG